MQVRTLTALFLWVTAPVYADAPKVMTDIGPVHSLVSMVMGDLSTAKLLIDARQDPHSFHLRPSQARKVQDADVIFWVSPNLIPELDVTFAKIAPDAVKVELLELVGDMAIPFDDHEDHDDDDGHDDQETSDEHAAHDHGDIDPHAWLDTKIARVWLDAIADTLIAEDPENAEIYAANQADTLAMLSALDGQLQETLHDVDVTVLTDHNALAYFTNQYPVGHIHALPNGGGELVSLSDAQQIISLIDAEQPDCAMLSAHVQNGGVAQLIRDQGVQIASMNLLGAGIEPGPSLYADTMIALANTIVDCGN